VVGPDSTIEDVDPDEEEVRLLAGQPATAATRHEFSSGSRSPAHGQQ